MSRPSALHGKRQREVTSRATARDTPGMGLRERLFDWRARRFIAPMVNEMQRDEQRNASGSEAWSQWWNDHGERELRCILMTAWDPVGSSDEPMAWDEYDGYMAGVAHRLRDTADDDEAADSVAAFLNHVERDYMGGLTPAAERRNGFLAHTLVAWHEWSFLRRGRPPHEWIDDD